MSTGAAGGATPQMEKLLNTMIQAKAADLFITVGSKPAIKKGGRYRLLETKVLDNDDTTALMKSITPDRCQQELAGSAAAPTSPSSSLAAVRFRVAVFKQRGTIGMVHAAHSRANS